MSNTPADWVKFVNATVEQVHDELGGLTRPGSPTVVVAAVDLEVAVARLEHVRHVLRGVASVFCANHDMEHYADGRTVASHLTFDEDTQYVHCWHPIPFQNYPRELRTLTTRNGTRKRVIVTTPGILNSVTLCEGEQ
jgi:hypothetical protein